MKKLVGLAVVIAAGAAAGAWYMARPHDGAGPVAPPSRPSPSAPVVESNPPGPTPADEMSDALAAVLSPGGSRPRAAGIPEGVRLLSAKLQGDVLVIDLSREFVEVNHEGSTGESRAMNALRAALAPFPDVRAMDVLVEGAPFEGDHAGPWKDIPVRGEPTPGHTGQ